MITPDILLTGISQIVCCTSDSSENPGLLHNGAIAIKDGKILAVGNEEDVREKLEYLVQIGPMGRKTMNDKMEKQTPVVIDCKGRTVLPGFVDSHTHVVFGGSRLNEFLSSVNEQTQAFYLNRASKTGIYASVNMTRDISEEELFNQSAERVKAMLSHGTTTIESKSGYGLDRETELKQLRVGKRIVEELPVDIYSTYLGTHGWDEGMTKKNYLSYVKQEVLPVIKESNLATSCDIWCDDGHYEIEECEDYLRFALNMGFHGKIHTDAYSYIGGSDLAADLGLLSADHLNYTPADAARKLVKAGVSGIIMPGTDYSVQHKKPANPVFLKENGLIPALATNCNPGNCIQSMQLILAFASRIHGMSPADAICSATRRGAKALGLNDRGEIREGMMADLQIWDTDNYENVFYMPGRNFVRTVIKSGKIVWTS